MTFLKLKLCITSFVNKLACNPFWMRSQRKSQDETRSIRDNSMQSLLLVLECFANSNIWSQTLENRVIWGTSIGLGRKQCVITACFPGRTVVPANSRSLYLLGLLSWERTFEIVPGLGKCQSTIPRAPCCHHLLGVTRLSEPQQSWPAQVPGTGWLFHRILTTSYSRRHWNKGSSSLPVAWVFPERNWWWHTVLQELEPPLTLLIQEMPQNRRGYTAD